MALLDIAPALEIDVHAEEAVASLAQQFVTFSVSSELFALPLSSVREIIRYPNVVKAPLGSPALDGLGNLRGTVLPILSLRKIFDMDTLEADDATRVVVLDVGHLVGLVVDRMSRVITVEPSDIESADAIRTTISSDLLSGVIKGQGKASMVLILDVELLIEQEMVAVNVQASAQAGGLSTTTPVETAHDSFEIADETQLVSFIVADQEYALAIEEVQEIVQMPEHIMEIPKCRSHVLGVVTLRDRLLPLMSLRRMLQLPDLELSESNKILVVNPGEDIQVGLVMDSVREVLRVAQSRIDRLPDILAHSEKMNEIRAICRLGDGKRLVSILDVEHLFDMDELRRIQAEAGQHHMIEDQRIKIIDDEEQLVVFKIMDEEYAVPIESVQEIVRVPDELVRVPKTPDFIEGVVNLRGAVMPVVDQRRRFGLPTIERNDRQRIVVFAINSFRTGFIVDAVSQVMRVAKSCIGPAPDISPEQSRLIRRVVNLTDSKRMLLMLEVDSLLELHEVAQLKNPVADV